MQHPIQFDPQKKFNRSEVRAPDAWDKFGIGLSAFCTAKCLGLPVLTAALPVLTQSTHWAHLPQVVWGFTALAAPGAISLAADGMRRENWAFVASSSVGMTLMAMGAIGHTLAHGSHHHGGMEGMDHHMSGMDHSTMGHDMEGMDHSMHGMQTGTQEPPAAIVYDPNASRAAVGDLSHFLFAAGGVVLGFGHVTRFLANRVKRT